MNLANLKVQELTIQEQKKIEGGALGWIIMGALVLVALICATDGNSKTSTTVTGPYGSGRIGN